MEPSLSPSGKEEMEKPAKKLLLKHFSHEHLLEQTRVSPPKGYSSVCFGCKHDILPGKRYYKCKTCPFFLHQVCYNMPQQVQHPVDPKHRFTLLSMPSSIDNSIECKACQQNITGFYYNCARCGNFYHTLCLAAPLSVKLSVHPHILELEFSPPYDFQCDLCDEPSYRGWLYHCGLCEFDAHVSCALMDRRAKLQMLPETKPLGIEGRIYADADTDRKDNELMELLSRGMEGNDENNNRGNFQKQSHAQDQAIPISYDRTPPSYQCTPSYQFSDAYFSIDFAKSFLNDDQASREADFQQFQDLGSKEARPIGYVVPEGLVGDQMQASTTLDISKIPSFDLHSSTVVDSRSLVEIGQENLANKVKQTKKSYSVRSRCYCW